MKKQTMVLWVALMLAGACVGCTMQPDDTLEMVPAEAAPAMDAG